MRKLSDILDVVPFTGSYARWLILDCGHWYKWTGDNQPEADDEFDCPSCKPLPKVMTVPEDEHVHQEDA